MGLDYGTLRAQRGAGMRHVDDGCRACDVGLRGQVAALKTSLRERVGELTACADGMHGELEALAAERDAADRQHEVECAKLIADVLQSQEDALLLKIKIETMEVERQGEREREKEMAIARVGETEELVAALERERECEREKELLECQLRQVKTFQIHIQILCSRDRMLSSKRALSNCLCLV